MTLVGLENFQIALNLLGKSPFDEKIFQALAATEFDVTVVLDYQLRIVANTPGSEAKLGWFFSQSTVNKKLLETFITLEKDRKKFKQYVVSLLAGFAPANDVCVIKLNLSRGRLTECSLKILYSCDESVWVGIRACAPFENPVAREDICEPTAPGTAASFQKSVRFNLEKNVVIYPSVSEEAGSSAPTSVIRDWVDLEHKKIHFRHILQRYLYRDFAYSIQQMEKRMLPADFTVSHEWLVPRYALSFPEVMIEETVTCLDLHSQALFMRAICREDWIRCSKILGSSLEGNADILSGTKSLSANADLLHCVFRLFISRIEVAHKKTRLPRLLELLDRARTCVASSLGRLGSLMTSMEMLLCVISKEEESLCGDVPDWVRHLFDDVLRLNFDLKFKSFDSKSSIMPLIYWVFVLWSCLIYKAGHVTESETLMRQVLSDTKFYCQRHPQSSTVRQLQCILCHNLAMSALEKNQHIRCVQWAYELQEITQSTYITVPPRCYHLIRWAERLQSSEMHRGA